MYLVFFVVVLNGCNPQTNDTCTNLVRDFPIKYGSSLKFTGCLLANKDGQLVFLYPDSIEVQLHPKDGNYSAPSKIEKINGDYVYYFNHINDRKLFLISNDSGSVNPIYNLKIEEEWHEFVISDPSSIDPNEIIILKPQWHLSIADSSKHLGQGFEYLFSGSNIILYSFIKNDSLHLKMKIVNHGSDVMSYRSPHELKNDTLFLSNDIIFLRKGDRISRKVVLPYKGDGPIYIMKEFIEILSEADEYSVLKNDLTLVKDTTDFL